MFGMVHDSDHDGVVSNSYNTSTRVVSDLQPQHPSARGWSDCKSDTARVGVL